MASGGFLAFDPCGRQEIQTLGSVILVGIGQWGETMGSRDIHAPLHDTADTLSAGGSWQKSSQACNPVRRATVRLLRNGSELRIGR